MLVLVIVIEKKHQTSKTEDRTLNIEVLNRLLLVGRWMFGVQRWAFASTAQNSKPRRVSAFQYFSISAFR
jgi:hypothetical protein